MLSGFSKVKKFGGASGVIATAVAIFIISQLVAGVLAGIAGSIFSSGTNLSDVLNNSTWAQALFIFFAEGLAIGLVLYILRQRKLGPDSIGLRKPKISDMGRGLVGFGIFYGLLIAISIILTIVFPSWNNTPQDVGFNESLTAGGQILAGLALVLMPPLGEEILVRGYLFSGLRARMSFVKAGLIVSLLFSIAHLQLGSGTALVWGAAVDTFILSLVLVYLRETTGALYAGMLVHALNNLIAFLIKFH